MSERWLEIAVRVDQHEIDDVRMMMARRAGRAVAVEELASEPDGSPGRTVVRAYLPEGTECAQARQDIQTALWHLGSLGSSSLRQTAERWITPAEYLSAWREFYKPLALGRRFLVTPSWSAPPVSDRTVIRLDPGMAFGTGLHASTQLAAEALEDAARGAEYVLDVGTGSGILAILAAACGARRVTAYDVDADAVRTAQANVALNDLQEVVEILPGRLPPVAQGADVLAANIVADVHLDQMHLYRRATRRGARVILGGIARERESEVAAAASRCGLAVDRLRRADDWACVTAVNNREARREPAGQGSPSAATVEAGAHG